MARVVEPCFLALALPEPGPSPLRVGRWAMRWTPRVHLEPRDPERSDGPPIVLLDLTGCQRANGGLARVRARLLRGLARRGVPARLGIAPTPGAAIAFAMVAAAAAAPATQAPTAAATPTAAAAPDATVLAPAIGSLHALVAASAPLPLEALRLPAPLCAALHEVNLRTVGELRAIGRAALGDRYGALPAQRLDALLAVAGPRAWPLRPLVPPAPLEAEFPFASPCTQREAVDRAFEHAVAQLCALLEARQRGARSLLVRIDRARDAAVVGTLHFGAPTRDPAHLWSLLRPRVERVDLGDIDRGGGVERILLRAGRLGRTPQSLGALLPEAAGAPQAHALTERAVGELVDQLAARVGAAGLRQGGGAPEPPTLDA
ncbi:MAG: hypothetical protein U0625_08910 [Phycisphaerales bacterium]